MEGIGLLLLLAALYFLPGVIAHIRNHSSMGGIWVLNIFLGWTGLGWLIALIWAVSGRHLSREEIREERMLRQAALRDRR
jgi:hypothetical protein